MILGILDLAIWICTAVVLLGGIVLIESLPILGPLVLYLIYIRLWKQG